MTFDHAPWTLAELTERVAAALAVGYRGQRSGRGREVPDQRAIRWYTTLGLVDRPADWRGRTALYGRRHLLQLTAIKRLQAAGHTLAEIQAELTGISDARLAQLAGAAGQGADDEAPASGAGAARAASARRFWAARSDGAAAWPEAGEAP